MQHRVNVDIEQRPDDPPTLVLEEARLVAAIGQPVALAGHFDECERQTQPRHRRREPLGLRAVELIAGM